MKQNVKLMKRIHGRNPTKVPMQGKPIYVYVEKMKMMNVSGSLLDRKGK
jgi:hypothetical protein